MCFLNVFCALKSQTQKTNSFFVCGKEYNVLIQIMSTTLSTNFIIENDFVFVACKRVHQRQFICFNESEKKWEKIQHNIISFVFTISKQCCLKTSFFLFLSCSLRSSVEWKWEFYLVLWSVLNIHSVVNVDISVARSITLKMFRSAL